MSYEGSRYQLLTIEELEADLSAIECALQAKRAEDNVAIIIDCGGGDCPVQIAGTICGTPFYFRARGAHWSLSVGSDPFGPSAWEYREVFGQWPDAGWMTIEQARGFLAKGARLYIALTKSAAMDALLTIDGELYP
jgi:hypothetical protein